MGKPLNQQRRGKGSPSFTAPSHLYKVKAGFKEPSAIEKEGAIRGEVVSFIDNPANTALLMAVRLENGDYNFLIAPEGMAIGDEIRFGKSAGIGLGNVLPLSEIPDGTPVYNIEIVPGDGGKLVRTAGSTAYVVSHIDRKVYVSLPSKNVKIFNENCRAQIGVISMGGRLDKPVFKAGATYHMVASTARRWPHVRTVAMSAYDHPFGGKQHHPGRSTIVAKDAPPGRKVGLIGPGSVGRKKVKKGALV
ncbi:MAG: 50S ribosomal protein L2 [Candidatus Micrarchaeia archaeon]